jgi:hypothetical protein
LGQDPKPAWIAASRRQASKKRGLRAVPSYRFAHAQSRGQGNLIGDREMVLRECMKLLLTRVCRAFQPVSLDPDDQEIRERNRH